MRNFLYSILVFLISMNMKSQENRFTLGIKGGFNNTGFYGDKTSHFQSKINYHLGVFFEFPISKSIYLHPEFIYSKQGSTAEFHFFEEKNDLLYDYLLVPILFKYNITEKLNITFGPHIEFLISSKIKVLEPGFFDQEIGSVENDPNVNDLAYGFGFGLGRKITKNIFINLRQNVDFSNVFKGENGEAKHIVTQLSLEYVF